MDGKEGYRCSQERTEQGTRRSIMIPIKRGGIEKAEKCCRKESHIKPILYPAGVGVYAGHCGAI